MIYTKQDLIKYLKEQFNNDNRITNELLFNDKNLTESAYYLIKQCQSNGSNQVFELSVARDFCLSHNDWYNTVRYNPNHSYKDYEKYVETEFYNKVMPLIIPKLEKFVGDTGCYHLSLENIRWQREFKIMVVSPYLPALELIENKKEQESFIFD